jgi:(S)-ureidoglycine aminohydrolase
VIVAGQTERRVLAPGIAGRSRAVVTAQYALMPAEGILASALPGFQGTTARVQTAPPMGARFAQMLLEIAPDGGTTAVRDDGLEHVFYVVGGTLEFTLDGQAHTLAVGGYVYVPVEHPYGLRNASTDECRVIWIKRPYEPIDLPAPAPIVSTRNDLERNAPHTTGRYWQYLLPTDDLAFDMQVNILGFEPGTYFPYVETHVMEHGLYMLEGQGVYLLAGDWHEVEPTDFIWMAPFCPQDFFCTGWDEAAYLLYKDVNRDVRFD